MTTLYLVRHGQTDWNLKARFQGHSDIPLNPTGMKQAAEAVQNLNGTKFKAIYTSDLQRAVKTADFFAMKTGVPIMCDERLREVCLGKWEGMEIAKIKEYFPEEYNRRQKMPMVYGPPEGETIRQLANRIIEVTDEICEDYPSGSVLIVAHGMCMATLYCLANGIDLNNVFEHTLRNLELRQVEWIPGKVSMIMQ
jgi:broad specificity phosphatase PhoE